MFVYIKSFSFLCSSVILPAVFNSELGVNIVKLSWVLMGCIIESDLSPFGSMLNQWEVETPLSWMLQGLGNALIMEVNRFVVPVFIGYLGIVLREVTESKVSCLVA